MENPARRNSGVFFHVVEDSTLRYVWQTGPEMQVLDNAGHADGRQPNTSAGSNFALYAPTRDATAAPASGTPRVSSSAATTWSTG